MNFVNYLTQHWVASLFWGATIVILGFIFARYGTNISKFFAEVWVELKKCSWPWDPQLKGFRKYRELRDSTLVVVASTLFLAAYVTSMDFVLVKVVGFLTHFKLGA